jgi:hypothetical protein
VAPGDGLPRSPPQGPLGLGGFVVPVEGDGRGVVVQLVEADVEFAHGAGDDAEGQCRDIGVEEAVEAAADPIVVERGELIVPQSQEFGLVPRRPLADAVEWRAGDQQVAQQDEQGGGRGDAGAAVLAGQVVLEELAEAKPAEEVPEDGQGGDPPGVEGASASLGAGGLARPSSFLGIVHPGRLRGSHREANRVRHAPEARLEETHARYAVGVVERPAGSVGILRLPERWVAEPTLAWIGRCRRHSRDDELNPHSCDAIITARSIHRMLRRLKPNQSRPDALHKYRETQEKATG